MSTFGAFTVTRASTKNVLGSNGLYQSVAINTPAFEFNSDGTYRGLLVELAATNLALRSEEFDTTWVATRSSISANATTAPNGTTTADKLIASVDNNTHFILQSNIVVTAQIYNASIFAKKAEYDTLRLRMVNLWSPTPTAVFNLTSKTVVSTTSATARITEYPDGWFRLDMTATINAIAGSNAQLEVLVGDNSVTSFTGDGTSGIYIWGAQLETGAVATSYIPTVASTETRTADTVTLTGASSLIGQSAGTAFVEVEILNFTQTNARGLLYLSDGTTNNRIGIQVGGATDEVQLISSTSGSTLVSITTNNNPSGIQKYAGAYALNDFVFYNNGVLIGTDTSATVPATSRIDIGGIIGAGQFQGWIRSVALFPSRLSNAQLASLTTL